MRKYLIRLFYLVPFIFIQSVVTGQVTISGPVCVLPGTTYQYYIHGAWDSAATMQVCVTGGRITDSTASSGCTIHGAPLGSVSVIWNPKASGTLKITTSLGSASINVVATTLLDPGILDTATKFLSFASGAVPSGISCSAATGGACTPTYAYQWQKSSDADNWVDMSGATGQNLIFASALSEITYYRRKVTETVSGSITYSGVATVDIR